VKGWVYRHWVALALARDAGQRETIAADYALSDSYLQPLCKQPHGESRGHLGVMPRGPRLPAHIEGKLETALTEKFKTDVRMLPSVRTARRAGSRHGVGSPRNGSVRDAARQQGRGETDHSGGPRY
jgi:AraC-like DNA-binding protein